MSYEKKTINVPRETIYNELKELKELSELCELSEL
jgi:hypothetical protein